MRVPPLVCVFYVPRICVTTGRERESGAGIINGMKKKKKKNNLKGKKSQF